jgi:biotin carboxyl carrier protein
VTFDVEAGGTRRTIEIRPSPEGWTVTVDGRLMSASVTRSGGRWSLLYGPAEATPAKRSYEVVLEPSRRGSQRVHVAGRTIMVSMLDRHRRSSGGTGSGLGPREIVAPMPGRVVKLLVGAGDRVAANQGLVVVEAMKMENELRAPREGVVAAVRVSEGMSVEANTVLVVVE